MSRRVRPFILSVALCLSVPALALVGGCDDKNLVATNVPEAGVELRYAFSPAASFSGHVNQRETIQGNQMTMNRSLDFNVQLRVTSVDDKGNAAVETIVNNLDITWALPPNMPYSLGEFVDRAQKRIDGVTIRFTVTPEGKVKDMPPMPEELDSQERLMLQGVLDGLSSAFFVVPERPLKTGENWVDEDTKGRQGKLGRYQEIKTTSTFDGLYKTVDTQQTLAKLTIETDKTETTTTKSGGHETGYRSKTTAMFDVGSNYLTSLKGTDTKFDSGETTTRKFTAEWSQTSSGAPGQAAAAEPATEIQEINDPCSPDYVGGEDCVEPGTEIQEINDPCSPDYVGGEECKPAAEGASDEAAAGSEDKPADAAAEKPEG